MAEKLVLLMYQSWADLDRAVAGLGSDDATRHDHGDSSIAWTVGHVTNMVDSWLNVRFRGLPAHPVISSNDFRTGGSGESNDWQSVLSGVSEVREAARRFLNSTPEPDLDRVIHYDGSIAFLRARGLRLSYALIRIAAHHFIHVGEITTVRSRLGHVVGDGQDWGRILA